MGPAPVVTMKLFEALKTIDQEGSAFLLVFNGGTFRSDVKIRVMREPVEKNFSILKRNLYRCGSLQGRQDRSLL